jgi:predicted porin
MSQMKLRLKIAAAAVIATAAIGQAQAQSNVQVYGTLDMFMGSLKPSDVTARTSVIDSGGMTTSFWGIGGSESLGGNLKTTFAIEGYLRVDTGGAGRSDTDPMFARNAYVGLAGSYGEVRFGRQGNPTFSATALFDVTGGSTRMSPLLNQLWTAPFGRVIAGDTVWANAIGYYSPTIAGFSGRLLYSLGEAATNNGTNNFGGMMLYQNGPFAATLAAQKVKVGPGLTATRTSEDVYVVGASYDFKTAKLFSQYDRKKSTGIEVKSDTFSLGTTIPVGAGKVLLSAVTTKFETAGAADTRRNTAGIGYDYSLSTRTDVYTNYLRDKLSTAANGHVFGVGVRHRF